MRQSGIRSGIIPAAAALAASCMLASACGENPDANVVGRVGWQLDYRDWTRSVELAPADLRDCDNRGTQQATPPYRAVAAVHVVVEDPAGQVPGLDATYDCREGLAGRLIELRGIVRQIYNLRIDALADDGQPLYRYRSDAYDATTLHEDLFVLQTLTGELSFFPRFDGVDFPSCPAGVASLRYTLTHDPVAADGGDGGDAAAEDAEDRGPVSVSGVVAACSDGEVDAVLIREVPVFPRRGANNNYMATEYRMTLEGLTASGETLYCGVEAARSVRPGGKSLGGNPTLQPGGC